jgi:hypothetical protein
MNPNTHPKPPQSWILVHSPRRYEGANPDNPQDELAADCLRKKWDRKWHWKLSQKMKDDERPRTILLAWDQCVFGEATATITQNIGHESSKSYNFAFVLHDYRPVKPLIPFSVLRLGNREHQHRSLIRLDEGILAAYRAARRGKSGIQARPGSVPEAAQIEAAVDLATNPQNGTRQGFGLTPPERKCVELHAMKVAKRYLSQEHFVAKDVSKNCPFDFLAARGGKTIAVEIKGTVGQGASIVLTKKEVQFQRMKHPANMLIVVRSIRLNRTGSRPKASAGKLHVMSPWSIDEGKLKPLAYTYQI